MKKSNFVNLLIILFILGLAALILFWPDSSNVSEELSKCIGENSVLYIQNGCIHCINQEKLFEETFKFINYVNCTEDWTACSEIQRTPTWKIDDEFYLGEKSIEELKNLTGC